MKPWDEMLDPAGAPRPHCAVYASWLAAQPAERLAQKRVYCGAGVPCARIGTTGGEAIAISGEASVAVEVLKSRFESWFPAYMGSVG